MSHQERTILSSLFAFFITFMGFYPFVSSRYVSGSFEGADGLVLLGKTGLAFIGVGIVAVVLSSILFSIGAAIVTKNKKPCFVVDERDRVIERRGMQISGYLTGAGLIAGLIALAFGQSAVFVLILIVASFALSEIIASIARLVMYRIGI